MNVSISSWDATDSLAVTVAFCVWCFPLLHIYKAPLYVDVFILTVCSSLDNVIIPPSHISGSFAV